MAKPSVRMSDLPITGDTMKNQSRMHTRVTILATVTIGLGLLLGNVNRSHAAPARPAGDAPAPKVVHTDDYQRSARLDTYRVIADSGAGRGENIYFYKCW